MPKEIAITRKSYMADRVLSWVTVTDGPVQVFKCAGLSLPWNDNEGGISCIPAGRYPFRVGMSPAKKRPVIWIDNVPGRKHIQIHNGNYPSASRGCEIVGLIHADIDKDGKMDVASSGKALDRLIASLEGQDSGFVTVIGDGKDVIGPGMNGWVPSL